MNMPFQYIDNVVTLEYNPDKCTGCGMCVNVCPHAVFAMENGKATLASKNACMECGACMRNCAFGAIKVRPGVGCAYAILISQIKRKSVSCGD
jgi:NAD-dependent dihydropyrimidine dehydrogenase PreA subunit